MDNCRDAAVPGHREGTFVDHGQATRSVSLTTLGVRTSRRRLLARLAALPAALGFAVSASRESVEAKKGKKGKGKGKRNRNKDKNKNGKGGSGGGGGGGYAADSEERAFLDMINDYRRRSDAGPLALQDQLGAAAEHHSQDMASKNYFSHQLANGDSAEKNIENFGYTTWDFIGENIAAGHETASKVMDAWQGSPEHDRNMRNKNFDEIGIGRAYDQNSKYGWYWTTTFGSRS
jgi:uncharacterized protein YkwD